MPKGRPKKKPIEKTSIKMDDLKDKRIRFEAALEAKEHWTKRCDPSSFRMQEIEAELTVARDHYYKLIERAYEELGGQV